VAFGKFSETNACTGREKVDKNYNIENEPRDANEMLYGLVSLRLVHVNKLAQKMFNSQFSILNSHPTGLRIGNWESNILLHLPPTAAAWRLNR
jgi:hypothetical protein